MTEKPSIDFGAASRPAASGLKLRPGKGLDVGTANLLSAVQDYEGNVIIKQQRNAFLDIEQNDFTRNMLTKMDVQYVVLNNRMIVVGDPAFDLANIHNRELRRPMKDGMLSPKEADALPCADELDPAERACDADGADLAAASACLGSIRGV